MRLSLHRRQDPNARFHFAGHLIWAEARLHGHGISQHVACTHLSWRIASDIERTQTVCEYCLHALLEISDTRLTYHEAIIILERLCRSKFSLSGRPSQPVELPDDSSIARLGVETCVRYE